MAHSEALRLIAHWMNGVEANQRSDWTTEELENLRYLDLSHKDLTHLPDALDNLTLLETLQLNANQLTQLPNTLGNLTNLHTLLVDRNLLIELPHTLGNLTNLQTLSLSLNKLTELPDNIGNLTNLQTLHMHGNQLSRLSDTVGNLTNLRTLSLSLNQLGELPENIGDLCNLRTLRLHANQLTELPNTIGKLTNIHTLLLDQNQLTHLPNAIGNLTNLRTLLLRGNQLVTLPDTIGKLTDIRSIPLNDNRLTGLPGSIGNLTRLETLDLQCNHLQQLPPTIGNLHNLRTLDLHDNHLQQLPPTIGALTNLRTLGLDHNRLNELPDTIGNLVGLRLTGVQNNPLPPEVLAADRTNSVVPYMQLLKDEGVEIHERKLLFVGEGQVGKSSLFAALKGEPFRELPSTHGVDVGSFLAKGVSQVDLSMRAWDFGGQEGYRPAHQLFFTSPAIYLVLWKPVDGPARGRVVDWIRLIRRSVLSDVKVLIVSTHGGPGTRHSHINEQLIRDEFGDMIFGFYAVDSRERGRDLEDLRIAIADAADTLPHAHRKFPRSWLDHQARLGALNEPYLPGEKYYRLGLESGLSEPSSLQLAKIADELGYWRLYESDDPDETLVVIKPDSLNMAMSEVLTDEQTRENQGLIEHSRIKTMWSEYPTPVRRVFLRLMEQGELTYRVIDPAKDEPMSLVGQLVPTATPDLTATWQDYFPTGTPFTLRVRVTDIESNVPILPEDLMNRIIVLLHAWSLGARDVRQAVHWSSGMLTQDTNRNRALITAEDTRIVIRSKGPAPDVFSSMCAEHIQNYIQRSGPWRNLGSHLEISCGEACPNGTPERGVFDYSEVIEGRIEGNPKTRCEFCRRLLDNGTILHRAPSNPFTMLERKIEESTRTKDRADEAMEARLSARIEQSLQTLFTSLNDIGHDGPRLITVRWADYDLNDPQDWVTRTLMVTLWCEHSKLPVCLAQSGPGSSIGVYGIAVDREWWRKARPWIRLAGLALKAFVPVPGMSGNTSLSENQAWKWVDDSLEVTKDLGDNERAFDTSITDPSGSVSLRTLHELVQKQDPDFAGLERVIVRDGPSKGQYRWVLPRYASLYRENLPEGLS